MATLPNVVALLGEAVGVLLHQHALAYIGPGAGLGAIIVVIALVLGCLLLLMGLVWYPLKRFRKSRTADAASASRTDDPE